MFHWLEQRPFFFAVVVFVTVAFAGIVEAIPDFAKQSKPTVGTKPYSILELTGRHVYIKDSCNACHSQLIRPFKSETDRYGMYSLSGEYAYDRPFLWGSKRTGPDLARIGKKYPDSWHYNHMLDPTLMVSNSIMPKYPWLFTNSIDKGKTQPMIKAMMKLGVPYPAGYDKEANADVEAQAKIIQASLAKDEIEVRTTDEIVALIAYLQRLGTDISKEEK